MLNPDPTLPISEHLIAIYNTLANHNELVLQAPPGAGKTTSVPLALMDAPWRQGRKIIMLEPRRVAARAAASRMAALLGETVGESVGYTVRLDKKVSSRTIIEVVTEGVLTRRLQQDPELSDTALVIFDEFHERSIHSDLSIALCLQARELFREATNPLKLLLMSATLDGNTLSDWLNAPLIRSEGRSYPVDIRYGQSQPLGRNHELIAQVSETILRAYTEHTGHILAFLPGQREINQCLQQVKPQLDASTLILALHGGIPLDEQQAAIAPLDNRHAYRRKIVLATDIAETSLTIDGVSIVIDSGLARKPRFDPRTGLTRLNTQRISAASSEQRAGRAGRQTAGTCYRLWSQQQQAELQAHTTPEIKQADLAPLALQLLQWGVSDPLELNWLDVPPNAPYQQAIDLLRRLNALDGEQNRLKLTPHGESMARLPTEPRLAHMLLSATTKSLLAKASELAALLSERIPLADTDMEQICQLLHSYSCPPQYRHWQQRILKQAQDFRKQLTDKRETHVAESDIAEETSTGFLLACAFPDRIAKKRPNSRHQYQLANGRSACLRETDSLAGSEWLAVAELGGKTGQSEDYIHRATPLSPALLNGPLNHLIKTRDVVYWENDRLLAEQQHVIGDIVYKQAPLSTFNREQQLQAVLDHIHTQGLAILPWTPELRQWQARVNLLHQHLPESEPNWPNLNDEQLLKTLKSWLEPWLHSVTKPQDIKALPLKTILEGLLPWPLPQQLDTLAPLRIEVPSGSKLAVDYTQRPPILEVKLQEMFGCKQTPTVAKGKVPLVVHLLSPARRPLQITQDLEGFWNSSYHDVKKEMKGRYPKHPWPDNPWEAQATRHTKKRQDHMNKK